MVYARDSILRGVERGIRLLEMLFVQLIFYDGEVVGGLNFLSILIVDDYR